MKKKRISLFLTLAIVLGTISLVLAAYDTIEQITTNAVDDTLPQISDNGDMTWVTYDGDDEIMVRDASGATQKLTNNTAIDETPRINAVGDIVWRGFSNTAIDYDIFYYKKSTGEIFNISPPDDPYPALDFDDDPQINDFGDVVWWSNDTQDWEIWFYDGPPPGGVLTRITDNAVTDENARLNNAGDIVWKCRDSVDLDLEVCVRWYATGVTEQISNNSLPDQQPWINDSAEIVWYGWDGPDINSGNFEIFYRDPANGLTSQLTTNGYDDLNPQINNAGKICWGADVTLTNSEIWCQDSPTSAPYNISNNGNVDCCFVLSENGTVVWGQDEGNLGEEVEIWISTDTGLIRMTNDLVNDIWPDINSTGDVVWQKWEGTEHEIMFSSAGGGPCDGVTCPDDGDPCTIEFCDPTTGSCDVTPLSCDDNTECTIDICDSGTGNCIHTPVICNDNNICTTDTCDDVVGCIYTNNTAPCEDGNPCTVMDMCANGSCQPGGPKPCDDGAFCNGVETCDTNDGSCDPSGNPCTDPQFPFCDDDLDQCVTDPNCVPEVCNGIDDDCDGQIDEGLAPRPTTCGVGECAGNTGTESCVGGQWGNDTCNPVAGASAETCNGLDDDCDGAVDENLTRGTTCGVGECAGNTGTETCTNGTWGGDTCNPVAGASAETCNGLDDDCDGNIDEFLTRGTTCGVGECAGNTGSETCTNGTWGGDTCNPVAGASAETCNGLDDDCDGSTDENLSRGTTCGVGECAGNTGTETCTNGTWGGDTCNPVAGASAETCNGLDDDCDGSTDENLSRGTTCGVGECAGNTGTETCTNGTWGGNTCNPVAGASAETCNGLDDDCDGSTDENLTRGTTCGVGECAGNTGTETCTNGTWGGDTCNPVAGASAETCNGLDDDCDGSTDENLTRGTTCGVGACSGNTGTETCTNGTWGGDTCNPVAGASAETCNNVDDDCDGSTDENLSRGTTCGVGACSGNTGTETCANGSWVGDTCDPLGGSTTEGPSGAQSCSDGIDNDCDGFTDASDGDCTDVCVGVICNDGNPCTNDSCRPEPGQPSGFVCDYVPNTDPCNDNNACTMNDVCSNGVCGGTAITCGDNNPCTDDSCNTVTGCVFTPNTAPCDDLNACTTGDTCSNRVCVPGGPTVCDDNDGCTTDSCDPFFGCQYTTIPDCCTNDACCDDELFCNGAETYDPNTGSCQPGAYPCNAGQPCNEVTDTCECTGLPVTTIRGGGQKPTTTDLQIQMQFTVLGTGGIIDSTASNIVVCPGTVLAFNCKVGNGPDPNYGELNGEPLAVDNLNIIICEESVMVADSHSIYLTNKGNGGRDTDRIKILLPKK